VYAPHPLRKAAVIVAASGDAQAVGVAKIQARAQNRCAMGRVVALHTVYAQPRQPKKVGVQLVFGQHLAWMGKYGQAACRVNGGGYLFNRGKARRTAIISRVILHTGRIGDLISLKTQVVDALPAPARGVALIRRIFRQIQLGINGAHPINQIDTHLLQDALVFRQERSQGRMGKVASKSQDVLISALIRCVDLHPRHKTDAHLSTGRCHGSMACYRIVITHRKDADALGFGGPRYFCGRTGAIGKPGVDVQIGQHSVPSPSINVFLISY